MRSASPLAHVRAGLPPFLLLCAEREVPGLHEMCNEFATALRKSRVPVEMKEISGCTHRTIVNRLHSDESEAGRAVADFVHRRAGWGAAR